MKLLIADDEQLTREGLFTNINWAALGIHQVYQADDGIHGLSLARQHLPEIILSDVRMPRMDGIEMARKIKEFLPDSNIIFMSGYSDKEYLKAAIRLKAVSYVEKPINLEEIEDSVREAIRNYQAQLQAETSKTKQQRENLGKLALKLCYPVSSEEESSFLPALEEMFLSPKTFSNYLTLILKFYTPLSQLSEDALSLFEAKATECIHRFHFEFVYGNKQDEYVILHLFGTEKMTSQILHALGDALSEVVSPISLFTIAFGKPVNEMNKLYISYNAAVILLQSAFFFQPSSILISEGDTQNSTILIPDQLPSFREALQAHERTTAFAVMEDIYAFFHNNYNLLPNQARDIYYKLFSTLLASAKAEHIYLSDALEEETITILDYVSRCNHLMELHQILQDKLSLFFRNIEEQNTENSTVYMIKEFISNHYTNESLSVKDISEHVFLSSSYVCTIFKAETGQTLNQFLTEYRIEKAKRLLEDARYKITDISARVGYSDGNYFGKTFKKAVGLSPSEYREKHIHQHPTTT